MTFGIRLRQTKELVSHSRANLAMRLLIFGTFVISWLLMFPSTCSLSLTPNFPCPPLTKSLLEDSSIVITCSPESTLTKKKVARHAQCIIRCLNGALRQFSCWDQGWSATPSTKHCEISTCVKIDLVYPWLSWQCSDGNAFDSVCTSSCLGPENDLYSEKCTSKGTWQTNPGFNDPRKCRCEDPDQTWQCQSQKNAGSTCSKECAESSEFATIVCKPNGEWETLKDCHCLEPSTQYPGLEWNCNRDSSVCTSKCGSQEYVIECYHGEWNPEDPSNPVMCQCPLKPDIEPSLDFDCPGSPPYSQGTICTTKCASGDDLVMTCDENEWIQTSDSCHCDNLNDQIPWDCIKQTSPNSTLNSKARQICHRVCNPESQNDDLVLNCLVNGEWDKPSEPCQCQNPAQINPNVDWTCGEEPTSNDPLDAGIVCDRMCNALSSSEPLQIECQSNGLWNSDLEDIKETCACQAADELFPQIPWSCENGEASVKGPQICHRDCHKESGSNEELSIQCQADGSWSNSNDIPSCTCKNPNQLYPQITWDCPDEPWTVSSSCSGDCAGQTTSIICRKDGTWDDAQLPEVCEEELKCDQENVDISNGRISCLINSKSEETVCKVKCKPGYVSKSSNILSCRNGNFKEIFCKTSKRSDKKLNPECEKAVFLLLGGTDEKRGPLKSTELYTGESHSDCQTVPDLPNDMEIGFGLWYQGSVLACGGKPDNYYECFVLETTDDDQDNTNRALKWKKFDLGGQSVKPKSAGAIDLTDSVHIYGGVDPSHQDTSRSTDLRWDGSTCELTNETLEDVINFKDYCYVSKPDTNGSRALEMMCGTDFMGKSCFELKNGNPFISTTYEQLENPSCALLENQDHTLMLTVESGKKIVVLGKLTNEIASSRDIEWTPYDNLLDQERHEPGLGVFNGNVLVFGGEQVEEINIDQNPLQVITRNEKLLIPRNSPIVVSVPKSRFCNT
ncbi:hypothetical protein TCAL_07240 [Tigriopus californicus]|uniref:Sushi domain-containing protein n=1 Tax=Tigriopus californicus TaxID=6832 RepID=A0A553NV23_TIGCA|nr:hypothetical protein TCAL_07240 [Tigriopus californicus]